MTFLFWYMVINLIMYLFTCMCIPYLIGKERKPIGPGTVVYCWISMIFQAIALYIVWINR